MAKNDLIARLMQNVKSAVQPGGDIPVASDGDEIGKQMQKICEMANDVAKRQADLAQDVNEISRRVSVLFDGVEELRGDLPKSSSEKSKPDEPKATGKNDTSK